MTTPSCSTRRVPLRCSPPRTPSSTPDGRRRCETSSARGRASCERPTKSVASSNATSTTVPSSNWSRSGSGLSSLPTDRRRRDPRSARRHRRQRRGRPRGGPRRVTRPLSAAAERVRARRRVAVDPAADAGPLSFDADGVGRYSPEVESAVYYSCLEAIQNATKHGGHELHISVTLRQDGDQLQFDVEDDGAGFEAERVTGTGLQNMEDRLGAVGGRLTVRTAPGHGSGAQGAAPQPAPSRAGKLVSTGCAVSTMPTLLAAGRRPVRGCRRGVPSCRGGGKLLAIGSPEARSATHQLRRRSARRVPRHEEPTMREAKLGNDRSRPHSSAACSREPRLAAREASRARKASGRRSRLQREPATQLAMAAARCTAARCRS